MVNLTLNLRLKSNIFTKEVCWRAGPTEWEWVTHKPGPESVREKERAEIGEGRALPANCSDPLVPRRPCHFKKWSNIINGGLWGLTSCSNSPVPRPSHHYGGPSRIKIQSLLWLVWLRRATAQRRGSDPLLPLPGESPEAGSRFLIPGGTQTRPGHCWGFTVIQCDASMLAVLKLFLWLSFCSVFLYVTVMVTYKSTPKTWLRGSMQYIQKEIQKSHVEE